jgi:hypothetical protein
MLVDLKSGGLGKYLYDIIAASSQIMICMATCLLYCIVFIGVLSVASEPICWLCIIVVELGLFALPIVFGYKYWELKNNADELHAKGVDEKSGAAPKEGEKSPVDSLLEGELSSSATVNLMLAIGIACVWLCFTCCLWFFRASIKRAIDVIDASADFVRDNLRIMLAPLFYFFLSMLVIGFWLGGYLMVASMNEITASNKIVPQLRTVTWT